MPACCKHLFVVLCFLFPLVALSQEKSPATTYSLTGTVKDKNGAELPGTVVFLSGSKKITATDNNGVFKLGGIAPGRYELTARMIGYDVAREDITIGQQDATTEVILHENVKQLNEVEITYGNNAKYLKVFLRYFIGESANASKCRLLNPEALKFHFDKKKETLTAGANDFLIIENKALGYRLKYLLNRFEFDYDNEHVLYTGSCYFEELQGTDKEKKQWAVNRGKAYYGSVRHFFRALAGNNLADNNFEVYGSAKKDSVEIPDYKTIIDSLWKINALNSNLTLIRPRKTLFVVYKNGYDETSPEPGRLQVSKIIPKTDSVTIDNNGDYASTDLIFSGYWAGKAIAELLPLDYAAANTTTDLRQQAVNSPAQAIATRADSFYTRYPAEKVFIQFDKPYYSSSDTIWLKAYVLDAALNYSKQSGLLYTELINDTGKVIIRQCMPVKLGISFGQMALVPETVPEGSYTIRAYTNWMQNQGEQSFFTRQLYIGNAGSDTWLVNSATKLVKKQGADNVELALQFTDALKQPLLLREMQLKVINGSKVLNKDNLQTDMAGKIKVNFNLPEKNSNLRVIAQDMRKGAGNTKLVIPIAINRPENIDLQFMPEGGQLVAGLRSRVGFKAIGEDSKGVDVKGDILDEKGTVVTSFQSAHKGMGSFELVPEAGKTYFAKLLLPDGNSKTYPLPALRQSGITMHISNVADGDSLAVTISATNDILGGAGRYSLIGQSGGKVCYAANLSFSGGVIHGKISKERFLSGITRFTLFNTENMPVVERMAFINHHDGLNINIIPGKQTYQPKDSIALHIKVTGKDNRPVIGSFSLAVTDAGQIKADGSNIADINSYMLLAGDLKGEVEDPGYYFDEKNAGKDEALDNLLLTQGWVGYDWPAVFNPKYQPQFKPEPDFEVTGHISRVGGKALGGLTVTLMSTRPFLLKDTLSDAGGKFVFKNFPVLDSPAFDIQVKDKKGKIFEANAAADEFTPAALTGFSKRALTPWYVNSDTTLLNYMDKNRAYDRELDKINYAVGTRHLKEVKIKALKVIKGSHNLNGAGNADQVLDEQDMKKAGKMTLEDMLNKGLIKGFGMDWFPKGFLRLFGVDKALGDPLSGYHYTYQVYDHKMHLVIDGVDVHTFFQPVVPGMPNHYEEQAFYRQYLQSLTAEDIKGVEVLYSNQYNNKYAYAYLEPKELDHTGKEWDPLNVEYAFLEITTWSGNGAYMKRTHGRYLYHPLPISWPKQFYKPKYTAKSNNTLTDLRAAVEWEPNVVTDDAGNATVWFYGKSNPADYTIIVQGSDLSGGVGCQSKQISIK